MDMSPTVIIAPEDRRNALRQPSKEMVFAVEHSEYGTHPCVLLDVSRTGVRYRSSFCFPCGSIVTLHPPVGAQIAQTEAQIMRQSVMDVDGVMYFEYGVRFTTELGASRHTWFLHLRQNAA